MWKCAASCIKLKRLTLGNELPRVALMHSWKKRETLHYQEMQKKAATRRAHILVVAFFYSVVLIL